MQLLKGTINLTICGNFLHTHKGYEMSKGNYRYTYQFFKSSFCSLLLMVIPYLVFKVLLHALHPMFLIITFVK